MTKFKSVLVAGAVAALSLLPAQAMASGCPDPDNPCTPQTIDVWAEICAKAPKLPKCWS